jgi:hypothetical protein
MSNYTITKTKENITLTPQNNITKIQPTTYNNTEFINNTTNNTIQAKKQNNWTLFSICSLKQITIPPTTHITDENPIQFTFTDPKGTDNTIKIPTTLTDFETEIKQQINPAFYTSMGYLYGFIKTILFQIYTDTEILEQIDTYNGESKDE